MLLEPTGATGDTGALEPQELRVLQDLRARHGPTVRREQQVQLERQERRVTGNFLGAWNIATNYNAFDIVTYEGQSWIALQANVSVQPVEGADWTLMAAKGDTGDAGTTGATGATGPTGATGSTGRPAYRSYRRHGNGLEPQEQQVRQGRRVLQGHTRSNWCHRNYWSHG